ncbi:metallophosphoesterase family protein [Roseovarius salinarum]|uniref:metallophosphoesterase family protein n=1 Tax=Roseovarius salinarum TaxID=1981892 RepID=UPI000C323FA6|nr:DNA repair exonuclease [Roseovarius salinarum]
MPRFLHTSDLHLAKPFGRFDESLRGRLREARFAKIAEIAQLARDRAAGTVLLAGDTFDAQTPPPRVVRQAIRAFADASDIRWVILPGNHDSLAASELWDRIVREKPDNVILALDPLPVDVGADMTLLPAPPQVRHPGRDLTEWMDDAETDPARVRVGLAHGGIRDFGSDDAAPGVIAPDRARSAGLDYLALGDWHGRLRVDARTWYSGAPEPDSFKRHDRAGPLLVEIAAPGATPDVEAIPTGHFSWCAPRVDLRPGEDIRAALEAALPAPAARRDALVRMTVEGRLPLGAQAQVERVCADLADDFGHFEADTSAIATEHDTTDLDDIDTAGALRVAAERLLADSEDADRAADERRVSERALSRLYTMAREVSQ